MVEGFDPHTRSISFLSKISRNKLNKEPVESYNLALYHVFLIGDMTLNQLTVSFPGPY